MEAVMADAAELQEQSSIHDTFDICFEHLLFHLFSDSPFGPPGTRTPPILMTSLPAFSGSSPSSTTPIPGFSVGPTQINYGIHPHM
ncbi:hypothetical protein IGI04_026094 [Brassica rapa subsp. trilocularis]|uniref:Uncharacterized protein n=1 Tax=Brassica rapa subsp. trilocularis TaxID=1813537 RepID=A0ABQ7KW91_BRACM|nr:hypothetical protein IGI04_026094 [Brassica rapa subsp. trilocularis]